MHHNLDYDNKKAQLTLTNPRNAKPCRKLFQFDVKTDDDDDFSFTSLCHITDD